MDHAVAFAETGHLCLAALHANNASQALGRITSSRPSWPGVDGPVAEPPGHRRLAGADLPRQLAAGGDRC